MATRVLPDEAFDDHVLVRCPACGSKATIESASGHTRLTCRSCAHVRDLKPASASSPSNPRSMLEVYNSGQTMFGAGLWLETECCGGKRLWALNLRHLDYMAVFVRATDRTGQFPSVAGARQLADKLPAWMTTAKHRDEVLRAIGRLRQTL